MSYNIFRLKLTIGWFKIFINPKLTKNLNNYYVNNNNLENVELFYKLNSYNYYLTL